MVLFMYSSDYRSYIPDILLFIPGTYRIIIQLCSIPNTFIRLHTRYDHPCFIPAYSFLLHTKYVQPCCIPDIIIIHPCSSQIYSSLLHNRYIQPCSYQIYSSLLHNRYIQPCSIPGIFNPAAYQI